MGYSWYSLEREKFVELFGCRTNQKGTNYDAKVVCILPLSKRALALLRSSAFQFPLSFDSFSLHHLFTESIFKLRMQNCQSVMCRDGEMAKSGMAR